jgi:hypothetical protein
MPSPEMEEFVKLLVQKVRDAATRDCDVSLRPNAVDPISKRWKEATHNDNAKSIVRIVVPECLIRWMILFSICFRQLVTDS